MVDIEEYGSEEWIARSRGNGDDAIAAAWARLEAKGFAQAVRSATKAVASDSTSKPAGPRWMPAVRGEATTTRCLKATHCGEQPKC